MPPAVRISVQELITLCPRADLISNDADEATEAARKLSTVADRVPSALWDDCMHTMVRAMETHAHARELQVYGCSVIGAFALNEPRCEPLERQTANDS